ncbi:GAF and ANTAR domain-containing protein [Rhodococcus fascians]|nr:GAF and ANTAR domain-containing protein [Rhodococcus fascians]MBY4433005.1 GAF and ANTAR domain-containing protein [Rhodococcus fascians]
MIDDNVFAPVTTHLATVSRMLTDFDNVREICATASEQARVIAAGVCAGVVLGVEPNERVVVATAPDTDPMLPDSVLVAVGSVAIDHNAVVVVDDTAHPPARWNELASEATEYGVGGLRAYPIRYGSTAVGALVVGTAQPWITNPEGPRPVARRDPMAVQILADLIAGAVRLSADDAAGERWAESIRSRATSTAEVEQAAGVLAQRHALTIPAAVDVLDGIARRTRLPVSDIAGKILAGSTLDAIVAGIADR